MQRQAFCGVMRKTYSHSTLLIIIRDKLFQNHQATRPYARNTRDDIEYNVSYSG